MGSLFCKQKHTLNVCVYGEKESGKTTLIHKILYNKIKDYYPETIGWDAHYPAKSYPKYNLLFWEICDRSGLIFHKDKITYIDHMMYNIDGCPTFPFEMIHFYIYIIDSCKLNNYSSNNELNEKIRDNLELMLRNTNIPILVFCNKQNESNASSAHDIETILDIISCERLKYQECSFELGHGIEQGINWLISQKVQLPSQ